LSCRVSNCMSKKVCLVVLLAGSFFSASLQARSLRDQEFLARAIRGFEQFYNIDYDEANRSFQELQAVYPEHPAPPLYIASVIWLRELFEREELDLDRFISPSYFTQPSTRVMDAASRDRFFEAIQRSRTLSETILKKNPGDPDATYFLGAVEGVLGAFAITIDRSYRQALSHGRAAYKLHHQLVEKDAAYYDAYMTVGLYEYIVDNLPWYVKWLALIAGYRGNQEQGFSFLKIASEQGTYVVDDAKVLLTVLYVREKRWAEALELTTRLHRKYPRNYIVHLNRGQILEYQGKVKEALEEYKAVINSAENSVPNYQKIPLSPFRLSLGRKCLKLNDRQEALRIFETAVQDPNTRERERALSHLELGKLLDLKGQRDKALTHYQKVLKFGNFERSHSLAREHLKRPYRG
jgi:tetratricopeptide (TPR) repeat protein